MTCSKVKCGQLMSIQLCPFWKVEGMLTHSKSVFTSRLKDIIITENLLLTGSNWNFMFHSARWIYHLCAELGQNESGLQKCEHSGNNLLDS